MKNKILLLIVTFTLIIGCNKNDLVWNLKRDNPIDGQIKNGQQIPNMDAPIVNTGIISNDTGTYATLSGEITKVGSSSITAYGHCWSTSQMPTIYNNLTNFGLTNSTGIFSSNITNLIPNTTYYARAYATNSYGTSYGNQVSFATQPILCDSNNCESLNGFTTWLDTLGYPNAHWYIGPGYIGNGIVLTSNTAYGGYIEFSNTLSNTGYMTFWSKCYLGSGNPGYIPQVLIDGTLTSTPSVIFGTAGVGYGNTWIHLQTQNILPGIHTIRINLPHSGQTWEAIIDEIQFWCL